ncbi:MAG TPA: DUF4388 domain-containing protein [Acidimicrobiales bacterium]|jgi:hypothetical protein|nr:DUF4388 domain-containing protein [Acidimicrobiales bacterium]
MADLEGALVDMRPAALLAFLAATGKTGLLRVAGHQHTVSVWLDGGLAVSADSTGAGNALLDQLVDLLCTPSGTFKFSEGALPRPDLARDPDPDLLPQAVERLQQWEGLADAVPSLSLHVKLLKADREDVVLSSGAWSVSVSVASGHASVGSVARHLKWSAFKTCQAVRELVEAGRADLVPPPKRRRRGAKVEAPAAAAVWHPANRPLWPGAGSSDRDRFSEAWSSED